MPLSHRDIAKCWKSLPLLFYPLKYANFKAMKFKTDIIHIPFPCRQCRAKLISHSVPPEKTIPRTILGKRKIWAAATSMSSKRSCISLMPRSFVHVNEEQKSKIVSIHAANVFCCQRGIDPLQRCFKYYFFVRRWHFILTDAPTPLSHALLPKSFQRMHPNARMCAIPFTVFHTNIILEVSIAVVPQLHRLATPCRREI